MVLSEDEVHINIKKTTKVLFKKLCSERGITYDRMLQWLINEYLLKE